MSDESPNEKPHAPTPRRKEEAKRKGQVPKSVEINAAILLMAAALVLQFGVAPMANGVLSIYGETLARATLPPADAQATATWLTSVGWRVLGAMLPAILMVTVVALGVAGLQGRGVLSAEPIMPKWEKLDPIKGAKKIWGWKAVMELGKSVAKLFIIGGAVFLIFSLVMDRIPGLVQGSPLALLDLIRRAAMLLLLVAGGAYLLLAVADMAFQIWQHERNLRMSQEELKREQKETDGDPYVKARRLSMGRALARRRMMLAVSEADVVVTNPVHYAIALKWDPMKAAAPIVLAMGQRKVALRIRERAVEAGVPVVENRPLARALYASARVGFPIPEIFYIAVAEILAFVFRERARRGRRWSGSGVA